MRSKLSLISVYDPSLTSINLGTDLWRAGKSLRTHLSTWHSLVHDSEGKCSPITMTRGD